MAKRRSNPRAAAFAGLGSALWLALAALLPAPHASAAGAAPLPLQPLPTPSPDEAGAWPRVFYSPAQRAEIEEARRRPDEEGQGGAGGDGLAPALPVPVISHYLLEGLAEGRKGATAWINGQMLQEGETYGQRRVHIDNGVVRLRQAGHADIVLRPGQQVDAEGALEGDVVPPDAVRVRDRGQNARKALPVNGR